MDHGDHVRLLKEGIPSEGGIWADLGSGRGAFTMALVELLGPRGTIFSVDKNRAALQAQERAIQNKFPYRRAKLNYLHADYTLPLEIPGLDGIVIANSLHFHADKAVILEHIRGYLRPGGSLILVEYNSDRGNTWVPYPLSFHTWEKLATETGFKHTRLLATVPSSFMGEIYSALSYKGFEHIIPG